MAGREGVQHVDSGAGWRLGCRDLDLNLDPKDPARVRVQRMARCPKSILATVGCSSASPRLFVVCKCCTSLYRDVWRACRQIDAPEEVTHLVRGQGTKNELGNLHW